MYPVIAIDGPAASGKSTVAKEIAAQLGYTYVNTGAMYRAVTWWMLEKGINVLDAAAVEAAIKQAKTECWVKDGETFFRIDGVDPLPHIRDGRVNDAVSKVASVPLVRQILVAAQQALAAQAPLVMEGRDIGTVVFPKSSCKLFVDADPAVREARRNKQGEADVIAKRDKDDRSRAASPLARAEDSFLIDSSYLGVAEVVGLAIEHVNRVGMKPAK